MHDLRRYFAASLPALAVFSLTPLGAPMAQSWPAPIVTLLMAVLVAVLLLRRSSHAVGVSAPDAEGAGATLEAWFLQRPVSSNLLAVMVVDGETRVHAANGAALSLVGHDRGELEEGRLYWNAIAPPAWHDLGKLVRDATSPGRCQLGAPRSCTGMVPACPCTSR